jgi:hypothetical protein
MGTGQEMIDVSEEDDSNYVDEAEQEYEGEEEYAEEWCVVPRSARKHVVREHLGVLGKSFDSASEYDQTDAMEETGSDWNDTPDEESEIDSGDTPQAVRVTRESWGPTSRNYPQRLYRVELDDGSVVQSPADDMDDHLEESADANPFYQNVIAIWPAEGNVIPIRPGRR